MSRSRRADAYKLWWRAQSAKGDPAKNPWLSRDAYYAAWDAQQAKIDRLMLEHCPDEMTADQKEEWARHQQPLPQNCLKEGK